MDSVSFDVHAARSQFPALKHSRVYFDNAGGSQVLRGVIDSINSYLSNTNVPLGFTNATSIQSTEKWDAGVQATAKFVNASPDEIALGSSTTQLFRNLSMSLLPKLGPDAELIISTADHEANICPWVALAKTLNLTVKWWTPCPGTNPRLTLATLDSLLTQKTRLVTCTHASNILGSIHPIRAIADMVHTIPGAMLAVDGVAYVPHRPVDVKALDVDFYAFSWYKAYGPHIAQLYAKQAVQD